MTAEKRPSHRPAARSILSTINEEGNRESYRRGYPSTCCCLRYRQRTLLISARRKALLVLPDLYYPEQAVQCNGKRGVGTECRLVMRGKEAKTLIEIFSANRLTRYIITPALFACLQTNRASRVRLAPSSSPFHGGELARRPRWPVSAARQPHLE